jgi:hypothetical protein
MRCILAILAGAANQGLHIDATRFGDVAAFVAVWLAILFYLFSIILVRYVFHYGEAELRGKNRYITLGLGTFIVVWLMIVVLFYTIGS